MYGLRTALDAESAAVPVVGPRVDALESVGVMWGVVSSVIAEKTVPSSRHATLERLQAVAPVRQPSVSIGESGHVPPDERVRT